jgi:CRP/FNR family transcriptional regulator
MQSILASTHTSSQPILPALRGRPGLGGNLLQAQHGTVPVAQAAAGARERIASTLQQVGEVLHPQRSIVHAGDVLYEAGMPATRLYILNAGFVKLVSASADGRTQVVGLKLRGDWLGFDGIAGGVYACDAVVMDTGEVWSFSYQALLAAAASRPALMATMCEAMSREITRDRDCLMSVCTLSSDARVADFLARWAESQHQASVGLRADRIWLRMTRADIGNFLGLTLETISRVLSRLEREGLIAFDGKSRRDIRIPDLQALAMHALQCASPRQTALQ